MGEIIDEILEEYFQGKYDLLEVRKKLLKIFKSSCNYYTKDDMKKAFEAGEDYRHNMLCHEYECDECSNNMENFNTFIKYYK